MPTDYVYLQDEVGPFWPEMPDAFSPFSKGPDSVDWKKARAIYDMSMGTLQSLRDNADATPVDVNGIANIEASIKTLLDTMQPAFRQMLLARLDKDADDETA